LDEYTRLLQYLEDYNIGTGSKKWDTLEEPVKEVEKEEEIKTEEYQEQHPGIPQQQIEEQTYSSKAFDSEKYTSLMRSKLIDDYKTLQSYERPYIAVSELYSCLRKNYYYRLKYTVDPKDLFKYSKVYLMQKVGNAIHEALQEVYDFTEVNKAVVSEKYKVKGKIDAFKDGFVYEIKTLDENKFLGTYSKEHYYQGLIYSYILNTEYNYRIDTVVLIYVFRDNLKRNPVAFDLPLDNDLAKSLLEKALLLQDHIQRKEVIDPIGATKDQCHYCEFKSFCAKDGGPVPKPYKQKDKKVEKKQQEKKQEKKTAFLLG
jgi:hypothetical protein